MSSVVKIINKFTPKTTKKKTNKSLNEQSNNKKEFETAGNLGVYSGISNDILSPKTIDYSTCN